MQTLTRIVSVVAPLALLASCATAGHPTPDAIYRNAATGDVQWCDKGSAVVAAVGGALMAAAQGADYASCKTNWEGKGYARLDSGAKLSADDQRRYEDELARMEKAKADSIRKN
jgi:hypothetical protein